MSAGETTLTVVSMPSRRPRIASAQKSGNPSMPMRPAETRLPAANGISTQPAANSRYGIGTSSRRFQSSKSITVQTSAKQMWTRKRSSWRSSTGPVKAFQITSGGRPRLRPQPRAWACVWASGSPVSHHR